MKLGKGIKPVILSIMLILEVTILSGCADSGTEDAEAVFQERTEGTVVQIRTDKLLGSGCIWSITEEETVIVTAGHVLEDAQDIQLTFGDTTVISGSRQESWEWHVSQGSDLGVIRIPAEDIPEEVSKTCQQVTTDKGNYDSLKAGDGLVFLGAWADEAENVFEGTLTDPWIYMEDYDAHMMLAVTTSRTEEVRPGMSGSGAYDGNGWFVGVLSGADASGNLAVVPLNLIWAEMEK